jgi:nitroreductase
MTLLEAIRVRRSVRTYRPEPLDPANRAAVDAAVAAAPAGPNGTRPRYAIIGAAPADGGRPLKIGTYGIIRDPAGYIVPLVSGVGAATAAARIGAEDARRTVLFDLGYSLERIVLELTRDGWGTCWLGGTFSKASVLRASAPAAGEAVYAVVAFGRPADHRTFMDTLIFNAAGAARRRGHEELFVPAVAAGATADSSAAAADPATAALLEAVRKAPSASNKQPWRLVYGTAGIDLYLEADPRYNGLAGYPIQWMDAGIAACHLETAATELGFRLERRASPVNPAPGPWPRADFVAAWAR